ncbi:MAG: type II toxin-antitoxin system VapC family toxin [Sphingopyxis sp.]|nr:type II toxin-antitoxin system VapC family toxin [Sphingopyxis sp.]
MRILVDTHALLWWAHEPEKLSDAALDVMADDRNTILVSAVSVMEIATKSRVGKLEYATPFADSFLQSLAELGFAPLPIDCHHAEKAGGLPGDHRDPWDRLLAAQASTEGLPLVTKDPRMALWNVATIW